TTDEPVAGCRRNHAETGEHVPARQGRPAPGLRRDPEIPERSALAPLPAVFRIFPRGKPGPAWGQPPDRLDSVRRRPHAAVLTRLMHLFATVDPEKMLESGKTGYVEALAAEKR